MYTAEEIENCDIFPKNLTIIKTIKGIAYLTFILLGIIFTYSVYDGRDFFSILYMEHLNYQHNTNLFFILTYLDNKYREYNSFELFSKNSNNITTHEFYEQHLFQSLPCVLKDGIISDINNDRKSDLSDIDYNVINLKEKSELIDKYLNENYNNYNAQTPKFDLHSPKGNLNKNTDITINHNLETKKNKNKEKNNDNDNNKGKDKIPITVEHHFLANKNHNLKFLIKTLKLVTTNTTYSEFRNKTHLSEEKLNELYSQDNYFDSIVIDDFNIIPNNNIEIKNNNNNTFPYYLDWLNSNLKNVLSNTLEIKRFSVGQGKSPYNSLTYMDNYNKLLCSLTGELTIVVTPALQLNYIFPYKIKKNQEMDNLNYRYDEKILDDDNEEMFKWYSSVNLVSPDYGKHKELRKATKLKVNVVAGDCFYIPAFWWYQYSSDSFREFNYVTYKFSNEEFTEYLIKGVLNDKIQ